jgi:transposase
MPSDENAIYRFHEQLLGLTPPWRVTDFKLDVAKSRLDIHVEWPKTGEPVHCPECDELCKIHDHREERTWRHLDTMQFQTFLHCQVPRADCPIHGVGTVKTPWAAKNSRFTLFFERFAIDMLLAARNITKACELLKISWDQLRLIMQRAVERGLSRRDLEGLRYVGIDEKAFKKRHKYMSILTDIDGSRVLDVEFGRDTNAANLLWEKIPAQQRESIRAVTLDMWEPFMNASQKAAPQADLVHDKFHVVSYLSDAVDRVRKLEHRELLIAGGGESPLSKTRYDWLANPTNMTDLQKLRFQDLQSMNLKVGRAWAIKEMFQNFWNYSYKGSARKFFARWFGWATRSKLKPVIEAAYTLKRHLDNMLTYLDHRITNATAEGFNSVIGLVKFSARGFRNPESFRTAILFYCGRLSLYP